MENLSSVLSRWWWYKPVLYLWFQHLGGGGGGGRSSKLASDTASVRLEESVSQENKKKSTFKHGWRIHEVSQVWQPGVVIRACEPSTWETETGDHHKFKTSLIYTEGSKTV